jgi:hypothetical protein
MNQPTDDLRVPGSVDSPGDVAADERVDFIRGAAGVTVDSRSVATVLLRSCLVVLGVLTVLLTVQAANENSRNHRLQHFGVPVEVTVAQCVGRASGTGITPEGFTCTGTFTLDGHRHTDVIGGASGLRERGDTLQAVTDPHNPSVLATTRSVATTQASWKPFIAAAIAFVVLLLLAGFAMWRARRTGRARSPQPAI